MLTTLPHLNSYTPGKNSGTKKGLKRDSVSEQRASRVARVLSRITNREEGKSL